MVPLHSRDEYSFINSQPGDEVGDDVATGVGREEGDVTGGGVGYPGRGEGVMEGELG